jgi:hypothetical protein
MVEAPGFGGAFRSADALAREAVLRAGRADVRGVWDLRIVLGEYETILWPELPERNDGPMTFFWAMMEGRHRKGARALVGELAGARWEFVRLEWTEEPAVYDGFTIHKFPEITVRRAPSGPEETVSFITGVVEYNGLYKVFSFRD